jgi:hypothetical protein
MTPDSGTPPPIVVGGSNGVATIQDGITAAETYHTDHPNVAIPNVEVEAGTYTENDSLSSADDGLTISAAPDAAASGGVTLDGSLTIVSTDNVTISGLTFQGADTAIAAGYSQALTITGDSFVGTGTAVELEYGTSDSTISDNTMTNTANSAIVLAGDPNGSETSGITVENNVIDGDGAVDTKGAIWLTGSSNDTITHNQITNTTGAAISLDDFSNPGTTVTQNNNDLIADNFLNQVDTESTDGGAIYILGRSQNPETDDVVSTNYIGVTGGAAGAHAVGIYLDDNASGVTVTKNIVQATPSMTDVFEIHGGSNNTISGNIFDTGTGSTDFGLFQDDEANQGPVAPFTQLTNDDVEGNVYATESSSPHDDVPGGVFADLSEGAGTFTVSGNDYWAYSGAALNVTEDTNPANVAPAPQAAQDLADYASWSGAGINFVAIDTSLIGPDDNATCYCRGTRIATPHGDVVIEALRIGDPVLTAAGPARPIRWIGQRCYPARLARRTREVWPVLIRAGALAEGVPSRDLSVSPLHAMYLDGLLVPAVQLVNGTSILQDQPLGKVDYIHLELDTHDVIVAEGAASESFVDDDSREIFHNADTYWAIYPDAVRKPALYCAPRVTEGFALAAIRQRIAIRAGLCAAPAPVPLRGCLDYVGTDVLKGWAQDPAHPEQPVCIDIVVDGATVARALANQHRSDLTQAKLGSGRHAFSVRLPVPLTPWQIQNAHVRRSSDWLPLPRSADASRAV